MRRQEPLDREGETDLLEVEDRQGSTPLNVTFGVGVRGRAGVYALATFMYTLTTANR
jgi:hypothetical protein